METIYISLRAQVAVGTFFMKSLVYEFGMAKFVKRNDNSCLHIREIWWQKIENMILDGIEYHYVLQMITRVARDSLVTTFIL